MLDPIWILCSKTCFHDDVATSFLLLVFIQNDHSFKCVREVRIVVYKHMLEHTVSHWQDMFGGRLKYLSKTENKQEVMWGGMSMRKIEGALINSRYVVQVWLFSENLSEIRVQSHLISSCIRRNKWGHEPITAKFVGSKAQPINGGPITVHLAVK